MSNRKVEFAAQAWEAPVPGVRMKVFRQAGTQVRLVEFAKDFVEPDWCLRGHAGYVLDGRIEVDFNGEVEVFGPGDGLIIPPGEPHKHKARALTGTVTVVLVEEAVESAPLPPHAAGGKKP